jgi:hypothetical protein
MSRSLPVFLALLVCLPLHAATAAARPVAICELIADPGAYDRKVVEVTAFVSHGFEDFTLFDPRCSTDIPRVWVEYGGTFASGTIYCCGLGAERSRKERLAVDGVETSIVDDRRLRQFDGLVQRGPDSVVHATIRGRFFAGEKRELKDGGTAWMGYGHFGMFSLLVVEEVVSVDPRDLRDVDYRAFPDQPKISDGAGCFSNHLGGVSYPQAVGQQREAEAGTRSWAFTDPARVATEHLRGALEGAPVAGLRVRKKSAGRIVYEFTGRNRYWVVVSRPYWLTFSAADRKRVAWVAIAAFETGCESRD